MTWSSLYITWPCRSTCFCSTVCSTQFFWLNSIRRFYIGDEDIKDSPPFTLSNQEGIMATIANFGGEIEHFDMDAEKSSLATRWLEWKSSASYMIKAKGIRAKRSDTLTYSWRETSKGLWNSSRTARKSITGWSNCLWYCDCKAGSLLRRKRKPALWTA